MDFMLNSCNVSEIEEALSWGIVKGITMNPSMLGRSERDFLETFRQIRSMTDVPVFAQVLADNPQEILGQGRVLAGMGENIIVKVHTSINGIKGMRLLKAKGIRVCATATHSVIEALVAAAAGADYAAVFVGLLAEVDERDSNRLLTDIRRAYSESSFNTKILAAARSVNQIVHAAQIGVDAVTSPFTLWPHFLDNIHTRNRWDAFTTDWKQAFGDRTWATELTTEE